MKSLKVLFGAALMLIAVVGAFAASNNARVESIFYLDATNNCVPGEVAELECEIQPIPDCVLPIIGLGLSKQVYANRTPVVGQPDRFTCIQPYAEVQP